MGHNLSEVLLSAGAVVKGLTETLVGELEIRLEEAFKKEDAEQTSEYVNDRT